MDDWKRRMRREPPAEIASDHRSRTASAVARAERAARRAALR
jgi:hypothetical protein